MTSLQATFLAVVVVIMASIAQVLLKSGIVGATQGQALSATDFVAIIRVILTPAVFFALCLYGLTALMWIYILAKLPLSTAYPILGLTFAIVPVLAALWLREPISALQIAGTIFIVLGVSLVNI
ncbi:hypothetical protein AB4072_14790 [Microvirga sp. 2MCAF38]|uniref:hypothetical protein n=1 Tax=Microvirga sp. 2MCAF38 TaxID=3232989 RepID=UPI003F9E4C81